CIHSPLVANAKVYIHEFIDIIGHNRAAYMHHMAANWSPEAQEQRHQLCYGIWAVLGSTGRWPQVVNIWEHDGWDGLAASFGIESVGKGVQDPTLEAWWGKAAELRHGGHDRILEPAPWTQSITELCAAAMRGECYAHEMIVVRNGAADEFLERVRDRGVALGARYGWELAGAWRAGHAARGVAGSAGEARWPRASWGGGRKGGDGGGAQGSTCERRKGRPAVGGVPVTGCTSASKRRRCLIWGFSRMSLAG